MGSKIAALQAGFMNDLNRRLQLGPQAPPKKEEHEAAAEGEGAAAEKEEKEKVPLSDARKGRARGPARRAPASAAGSAAARVEEQKEVVLGFVGAVTFFEIDPDQGTISAGGVGKDQAEPEPEAKVEEAGVEEKKTEGVQVEAAPPAEKKEEKEEAVVAAEPNAAEEDTSKAAEANAEPEAEPEPQAPAQAKADAEPDIEPEPQAEKQETKSLATNMAGETLVAEEVKKDEEHEVVEPVKVVEH
jgi:hypothetical protein